MKMRVKMVITSSSYQISQHFYHMEWKINTIWGMGLLDGKVELLVVIASSCVNVGLALASPTAPAPSSFLKACFYLIWLELRWFGLAYVRYLVCRMIITRLQKCWLRMSERKWKRILHYFASHIGKGKNR